ncbi:hypothetical protein FE275_27480 [Pseudomonas koreensis]|nr:hypothetical protein FE275_27480 [Pseudomonas koreensis]
MALKNRCPFVGAGLLAKVSGQPTSPLNDTPLSRASPLPHGFCGGAKIDCISRDLKTACSSCLEYNLLWERACSRRRQASQQHR